MKLNNSITTILTLFIIMASQNGSFCHPGPTPRQRDILDSDENCAPASSDQLTAPRMSLYYSNWTSMMGEQGEVTMEKVDVTKEMRVIAACQGPYVINYFYDVNYRNLLTAPQEAGLRTKVFYKDFFNCSTYEFYARAILKMYNVTEAANFSCQSMQFPCLHHTLELTFPQGTPNAMTVTLRNKTDECSDQHSLESAAINSDGTSVAMTTAVNGSREDKDCDAYYYYEETTLGDTFGTYGFRCEFADGSPGVIRRFQCSDRIKCTNLFRKGKELDCWRRFSKDPPNGNCSTCDLETETSFNPFMAVCLKTNADGTDVESSIGALGFYGVKQENQSRPAIFFSADQVIPSEMINFSYMEVVGDILYLECRLSGYWNSATFQFALEVEGEERIRLLPVGAEADTIWDLVLGVWKQNMSVRIDNSTTINRVYCFGNIQNSYQWVNASKPFPSSDFPSVDIPPENGQSKDKDGTMLTEALIGVALAGVAILVACVAFIRWRGKRMDIVRDLSKQEIKNFLNGHDRKNDGTKNSKNGSLTMIAIHGLPYDKRFETSRQNIEIDESGILGSGEFGVVMKGFFVTDDRKEIVAVKRSKPDVQVEDFLAFLCEIKILAYLDRHPNTVALVAACTSRMKNRKALVALEFCENGNLKNFLHKHRDSFQNIFPQSITQSQEIYVRTENYRSFDEMMENSRQDPTLTSLDLLKFSAGVANGLSYLSEKQVIHGDIAARNILVSENMEVKICDFGLSSLLLTSSNYVKKQGDKIPWKWMSIEALKEGKFSIQSDIWSFGVALHEIFSLGEEPYQGLLFGVEFHQKLEAGYRMEIPLHANDEIYALMQNCWKADPKERPACAKIYHQILDILTPLDSTKNYQLNFPPEH